MKRHFDKTAAEIIGEKINSVKDSIKTREAVINVVETINGLIKDFDKKVFNNRILNALNAELQSLGAPFTLEITDINPGGARLCFRDAKTRAKVHYTYDLLLIYTPGERRIDAAKTIEAGLALVDSLKETNDQDRAQIGNYKKMVKPLQKAFDAFEAFAAIPGSAYIGAEHFIEKSFITETFYAPSPAFHVYYDLLQSTFRGL